MFVGVYPVPEEGGAEAFAPSSGPLSSAEPVGAGTASFLALLAAANHCKPFYL